MAAVAVLRVNGTDVAPLDVTQTRAERRRGLLGRDGIDGGLLIMPCRSVHTVGMRFAIDVAHLARTERPDAFAIVRTQTMPPQRLGRPVLRAAAVLEAGAGSFAAWGLAAGSVVEVVRS